MTIRSKVGFGFLGLSVVLLFATMYFSTPEKENALATWLSIGTVVCFGIAALTVMLRAVSLPTASSTPSASVAELISDPPEFPVAQKFVALMRIPREDMCKEESCGGFYYTVVESSAQHGLAPVRGTVRAGAVIHLMANAGPFYFGHTITRGEQKFSITIGWALKPNASQEMLERYLDTMRRPDALSKMWLVMNSLIKLTPSDDDGLLQKRIQETLSLSGCIIVALVISPPEAVS
ncbi:MAG: hypothetical protein NT003_02965 [Candidatus Magasanikbacteria bacterium]|nr:hypothetical protein [Candidatus Magasanikbacteria bacterium]